MAIRIKNKPLLLHFFMITICFFIITIPLASALSFNYSSFSPQYDDGINYERAYPDSNRVIQLPATPETSGRATYGKPVRLWDKTTGNLTDFTTHFSFAIDSESRSFYGDGMAFFLAPEGSKNPANKGGGSFGLTKDNEPLNSSFPFVAVEFDIYNNSWDPPGQHVGIDINSVKSINNETWLNDIPGGRRTDAWISYNSKTHNLNVVFTGFRGNTTVMQYLDYHVDLKLYLPESVTFGFSMATGSAYAKYSIYSWEFSSTLEVNDSSAHIPAAAPSPCPDGRQGRKRKMM